MTNNLKDNGDSLTKMGREPQNADAVQPPSTVPDAPPSDGAKKAEDGSNEPPPSYKWLLLLVLVGLILLGVGVFILLFPTHATPAVRVAAYFFFALGAAVILFGVLRSTARGKKLGFQVSGAVAGFLVVFLTLFFVDPSPKTRELRGIVLQPDGIPLEKGAITILGVEEWADECKIEPDDHGRFVFANIPAEKQYSLQIKFCQGDPLVIKVEDAPMLRVHLPQKPLPCVAPTRRLVGSINLPDGNPLEKGKLVLLDLDVKPDTSFIEPGFHGRFSFENVPAKPDEYRFQLEITCPQSNETKRIPLQTVKYAELLRIDLTEDQIRCQQTPPQQMVRVEAGAYPLGCAERDIKCRPLLNPQRAKPVKNSFEIMKNEVTVNDYQLCMLQGSCPMAGQGENCNTARSDRGQHPVNCVNWSDADDYCRWLGMRLPSQEEWEVAARGLDHTSFPWRNEELSCKWAVMRDDAAGPGCGRGSTWPVGSQDADRSWCGVMDLGGNVREWVNDDFPFAPSGDGSVNKEVRGGSWLQNSPEFNRAYSRDWDKNSERRPDLGFRCAKDVK